MPWACTGSCCGRSRSCTRCPTTTTSKLSAENEMPITFACAASHAPGITAWTDAAPAAQKDKIYGGFQTLRERLDASGSDTLIVLTSEHWANFFLDHIGAFCVGRAASYRGPVEPWLP